MPVHFSMRIALLSLFWFVNCTRFDLEDKIAYYQDQSTTLDPKQIAEGKANTLAQIKSIQMARVSKANLNDLVQQVVQLTNQVTQLQNDIKSLKKTP